MPGSVPDSAAGSASGSERGALPTYLQISEAVARDIQSGRLLDGEKLPPERVMAAQFGVAVGTLRKALTRLERHGQLRRVQGSGNYVRQAANTGSVYAFFRLELLQGGGLPRARLLSLDLLPKPPDAPNFGAAPDAFRFRRLRLLDDTPVALEEIWLDRVAARGLNPDDVSESLYHLYQTRLGLLITRAEDRIGLAPVPDWRVDQFGLPTESPAGYIERIAFDQRNAPVEFSRNWFDTRVARYVSRLK